MNPFIAGVVGLMTLQSPPTNDPLTADTVRANVRRASGYERLAGQATGLRASGAAHVLGNDFKIDMIFDSRGDFVSEYTGPLHLGEGFDGQTAWSVDFNGQPRPLDLGERAEALLVNAAVTGRWSAPDSTLRFTLDAEHTNNEQVTLAFRGADDMQSGKIEIDRATWRPRRFTISGVGSGERIVDLEGACEFDRIWLPATVRNRSPKGGELTLKFDQLAAAPTFIRSPYQMPPSTPDAHFAADRPATLEVERAPTGHLLVRPKVNGRESGWFIVDTGAGITVLNSTLAGKLDLKKVGAVPALGVGGSVESPLYQLDNFEVGPLRLEHSVVIALNLDFLTTPLAHEIDGILGFDVLSRCVFELDLGAGRVALNDPAKYRNAELTWGKLYLPGRIPAVDATFEGHAGVVRLDSGKSGEPITFHYPAVQRFKLLEGRATTAFEAGGVGGTVPTARGKLKSLEFAGQKLTDLEAGFVTEGRGALADAYAAGVMGAQLMRRYNIVIDYPGRRIAFVKQREE